MMRVVLAALLLSPALAAAETNVEVGVAYATYDSQRVLSEPNLQIRVGGRIYLWGGYENPDLKLVGQSIGDVKMLAGGAGFRHQQGPISFFAEFGLFRPDVTTVPIIRNEAVWTQLRNDHGDPGWHPTHTVYELEEKYGGRIGVGYDVTDYLKTTVVYRVLRLDEELDACTGSDPKCGFPVTDGLHWQNRSTLNMSAVELGLFFTF
jgi:hypothetical protein